ncbi:MAG: matrixin family metalloprotease [Deltaproteobacteria bacterium]|nr:matrixin family metalloprotease [Deltaproteobacteria bacterium]
MIRRRLLASAVGVVVGSVCASALAYNAPGIKWPRSKMPVAWEMSSGGSADLGESTSFDLLKRAFGSWSSVCCTYLTFGAGSITTSKARDTSDTRNILQWLEQSWPADLGDGDSVLGVTTPVYWNNLELFDADIVFNGVDHAWDQTGRWPKVDLQSIATHEIGHLLGLNHSQYQSATMYYMNQGGAVGRSLEQDDMQGVCAIYPKTTPDPNCSVSSQGGRECTLDNDCLGGNKKCVNYACVDAPTGVTGTLCQSGDDCANGLCVSSSSGGMCTQACDPNASNCPSGFACNAQLNNGQNICVPGTPSPNKGLGETCTRPGDCRSRICVTFNGNGICTQSCNSTACPSVGTQPYECIATTSGDKVCVPAAGAPAPKSIGDACNVDTECSTGRCMTISGRKMCSKTCQAWADCPVAFECAEIISNVRACIHVTPTGGGEGGGGTTDGGGTGGTGGGGGGGGTTGPVFPGGTGVEEGWEIVEDNGSSGCSIGLIGGNASLAAPLLLLAVGTVATIRRRRPRQTGQR